MFSAGQSRLDTGSDSNWRHEGDKATPDRLDAALQPRQVAEGWLIARGPHCLQSCLALAWNEGDPSTA